MIKSFLSKVLLFPYYWTLSIRNFLYDCEILKSKSYDIPIICIGNITVGGTGKTPHTEYLIKELGSEYRVAVLSRGYGRKTQGFRIVQTENTPLEVGDEPLQMKRKFPDILIAVDEKRTRGIESLLALPEDQKPTLILLDDAYQHRSVKPSVNILLIDYSRPLSKDALLPLGSLRDLPKQKKRAEFVIITKCPGELELEEKLIWKQKEEINDSQELFFSKIDYASPIAVFEEADRRYIYSKFAIVITGIANPKPLIYFIQNTHKINEAMNFKDHHNFSNYDISRINRLSRRYPKCVIYTTEKDSQRLFRIKDLSEDVKKRLFYLPIEVTISNDILQNSFISQLKARFSDKS